MCREIVGPRLTKVYCVREPISAGERLPLTLRYLASGDSMISISYAFRIAPATVSSIINETCNIIWDCLNESVLFQPTEESWLKIAQYFKERWPLPHCVGAIDGKHVVIQAPKNSGSTFFNYKGTHSIILLALCDASNRFTLVDIGAEGRHSDGTVFKNSNIGKLISTDNRNFPEPTKLGSEEEPMNYYIAADEAFPLSTCIMRPYPGHFLPQIKRIFNYRLCRARRVIENVFGILVARWRIYRKPIIASQSTVMAIVKATVCLHNYLMNLELKPGIEKRYCSAIILDRENDNGDIIEGEWRNEANMNLLPVKKNQLKHVWQNSRAHEGKFIHIFGRRRSNFLPVE